MRSLFTSTVFALLIYFPDTAMSEESPIEVALSFFSAMEKMDFDTGLTFVDENIVYINSPGTIVHGHSGVREVLEPFFATIQENEFIVERQAATGNVVFIQRLDRHRIPQGWFELPVAAVMEINNGKITYWREYFDVATIRTAMAELMSNEQ